MEWWKETLDQVPGSWDVTLAETCSSMVGCWRPWRVYTSPVSVSTNRKKLNGENDFVAELYEPSSNFFLYISPHPSLLNKGRKPNCANPAEANVEESEPTLLIRPEDIVLKGSSEKTLRTLLRPNDKVSSHYKTTSPEISAVVGAIPSICEYVTIFVEV